MRLSAQPACPRALMHASMIACVISSTFSLLMPSSRARLPAARAAAISMSATIGSVSSICRSAACAISGKSSKRASKGKEQRGGGLDPVGDAAELLQREQRQRVHAEHCGDDELP